MMLDTYSMIDVILSFTYIFALLVIKHVVNNVKLRLLHTDLSGEKDARGFGNDFRYSFWILGCQGIFGTEASIHINCHTIKSMGFCYC